MWNWFAGILLALMALPVHASAPNIDALLCSGKFAEGIVAAEDYLKSDPKDDQIRFGLAVLQFVQGVEQLGRKLAVYDFQSRWNRDLNELLPSPAPPKESLTYTRLRTITQEWLDDLARVDGTLSGITDSSFKLSLHVGSVPVDLAGTGARTLTLLPLLNQFRLIPSGRAADFVITFDRGDADWLRGYCHLLMATGEISQAYDGQGLFDVIAHRLFKYVKTPYPFLQEGADDHDRGWFDFDTIADLIAAIHMMRFPIIEPKRMETALAHLQQTVSLSRQMWKQILSETDDDQEWIPNPQQKGALQIGVTQDMVDHWFVALDEVDALLQGKKLIPFWRGKPGLGVNLRRVFLEPMQLDLVLWSQGSAAAPYLEQGELTSFENWRRVDEVFGGQFLGFGFWFN